MDNLEQRLKLRSAGVCEMCASDNKLQVYEVSHAPAESDDNYTFLCETCVEQIDDKNLTEPNHWRCLNDCMWSPVSAVQVLSYRMLDRLRPEGWPADLIDMLYLEDSTLEWAKAGLDIPEGEGDPVHRDSNGATLTAGDTVVLTKDLNVKGTSFTAKRGTAVRNIHLVHDNHEHIEGKVNGTQIVILTKFTKKS